MALSLWMALMFGKLSGNLHVKSLSQNSGMRRIYSGQRTELELEGKYYICFPKEGKKNVLLTLLSMKELSRLQINPCP